MRIIFAAVVVLLATLCVAAEATTFQRVGVLTTPSVADYFAAAFDPTAHRAYFVSFGDPAVVVVVDTYTGAEVANGTIAGVSGVQTAGIDLTVSPPRVIAGTTDGRIVSINTATFAHTQLALGSSPGLVYSVNVDNTNGAPAKAYATTSSGRIYRIRLDATPVQEQTRDALDVAFASVIDPARDKLFLFTLTKPSKVSSYALSGSMAPDSQILLESGEDFISAASYDPVSQLAFVGTDSDANFVIELDLSIDPQPATRTGRRVYVGGSGLRSVATDPTTGAQYWGANSIPSGFVYLVNATTLELVETLSLLAEEKRLNSAVIDAVASRAYFGTQSSPGRVVGVETAGCPNNCFAGEGAGTCGAGGVCQCAPLRGGFDCAIRLCENNCGGPERGVCDQGVCFCNANYTGTLCELRTCLGGCGEELAHGTCDDGTCVCVVDEIGSWNGANCDVFSVACKPVDCSGHGVCPISLTSDCVCDAGWDFSPLCDVSDADADSLIIQVTLSKPYNRTEFVAAVVFELGILEECLLIKSEPPETEPDTVVFTLISCEQPGVNGTSGADLVKRLTDVLTGKAEAKVRDGDDESALGQIGVPLRPPAAEDKDSSGATTALIVIIVVAVVLLVVGVAGYVAVKRKLLADARAKRDAGEFDNLELQAFEDGSTAPAAGGDDAAAT